MQNCPLGKSGEEISGYLGLLYFLSRTGDHLTNSQDEFTGVSVGCPFWDQHLQPLFRVRCSWMNLTSRGFVVLCLLSPVCHSSVSSELT